MRIQEIQTWREAVELTRPYSISSRSMSAVDLFFVRIVTDTGHQGLGSGSPGEEVTGESPDATEAALSAMRQGLLIGLDPRQLGTLCRRIRPDLESTPAAQAALDMALHDLFCRIVDVPLVDFLGRSHVSLPTSITIGIKSIEESLAEAEEYLVQRLPLSQGQNRPIRRGGDRPAPPSAGEGRLRRQDPSRCQSGLRPGRHCAALAGAGSTPTRADRAAAAGRISERSARPGAGSPPTGSGRREPARQATPRAWPIHLATCGILNIKLMKCGGSLAGPGHRAGRRGRRSRAHVGLHGRERHQHRSRAACSPRLPADPLPRPGRQSRSGERPGQGWLCTRRGRVADPGQARFGSDPERLT